MGAFVTRQPNGLLCRFSTVVDTVTHYNMTDEEYIEMRAERAREEAKDVLKNHLKPFEWVTEYFVPDNMTQEEFDRLIQEMSDESIKTQLQEVIDNFCSNCKHYQPDKNTHVCTNEKSKNFNTNTAPFQKCNCFSENKTHTAKEVIKDDTII